MATPTRSAPSAEHLASLRRISSAAIIAIAVAILTMMALRPVLSAGMTEGWTKVATGGFTDRNNSYAPATIEYKGFFYLSTVANESGFIFSKSHKQGGDIWRSLDGVTWERIGEPGFGNPHNSSFNFVVFRDKFYALANNINDHGVEVWVSDDGVKFTRIEAGGFGDAANNWVNGFVFADRLILAVSGARSGPQLMVSEDGATFHVAVANGIDGTGNTGFSVVREQPIMGGRFYIGTTNPTGGGEIWRTADGLNWERVAEKGIERQTNTSITPYLIFKDQIYAIGASMGSLDQLKGVDVYRSSDGMSWERVVSDGFEQGRERNVTASLVVFRDRLYLTANTMDPRILMPGHPRERLKPRGFQLWVSDDGAGWTQVGKDGFSAATTLYGNTTVIEGAAYLSAFDYHKGGQLYRSEDGVTWTLIYREPDPSLFGMGGGAIDFKNHLLWLDHDLALGLEIWRQDMALTN
jgi:hypothetical protein